ncbi:hypothetical protein [Delftia sp. ASV31]|uniref:hypothetical protein n=1 Tax=Delftia sp. ASV31 TaxID=2795113 RepID=UPI0018EB595D|nr:hypothetical protein [Delftia sp. ASV31]
MTTLAKPTPIGALYANLGVNTSVVQVVAPGNNLHGLVIRTLYVNSYAGTIGVQVYADTAAPSAYGDGTKRLIFIGTPIPTISAQYSLYVPPGQGIWAVANGNGSVNMTYDLLTETLV